MTGLPFSARSAPRKCVARMRGTLRALNAKRIWKMKWLLNNWFLLALIALACCAIPGVILVMLTLVGWDAPINEFLRDNLQISYELRLSPWIALILLFLPIVLVILYFLKLKRKPIQVPS